METKTVREEAMERSVSWWYCDNILHHPEQIGLLRMDFPRVFILIRDYADACFASFDEFMDHVAEVNFFVPAEREEADIEEILTDAWNFLALQEEEEERLADEMEDDEDF